jgi:uncharacterized phage infection (PIP) family protein YhgE
MGSFVMAASDRTTENIKDKATEAIDTAADTAEQLINRGKEAGEKIQEVATNLKGAVDQFIKHGRWRLSPWWLHQAFVLGVIWKS